METLKPELNTNSIVFVRGRLFFKKELDHFLGGHILFCVKRKWNYHSIFEVSRPSGPVKSRLACSASFCNVFLKREIYAWKFTHTSNFDTWLHENLCFEHAVSGGINFAHLVKNSKIVKKLNLILLNNLGILDWICRFFKIAKKFLNTFLDFYPNVHCIGISWFSFP